MLLPLAEWAPSDDGWRRTDWVCGDDVALVDGDGVTAVGRVKSSLGDFRLGNRVSPSSVPGMGSDKKPLENRVSMYHVKD